MRVWLAIFIVIVFMGAAALYSSWRRSTAVEFETYVRGAWRRRIAAQPDRAQRWGVSPIELPQRRIGDSPVKAPSLRSDAT